MGKLTGNITSNVPFITWCLQCMSLPSEGTKVSVTMENHGICLTYLYCYGLYTWNSTIKYTHVTAIYIEQMNILAEIKV